MATNRIFTPFFCFLFLLKTGPVQSNILLSNLKNKSSHFFVCLTFSIWTFFIQHLWIQSFLLFWHFPGFSSHSAIPHLFENTKMKFAFTFILAIYLQFLQVYCEDFEIPCLDGFYQEKSLDPLGPGNRFSIKSHSKGKKYKSNASCGYKIQVTQLYSKCIHIWMIMSKYLVS